MTKEKMDEQTGLTLVDKIQGALLDGDDVQRVFDRAFLKKLTWEHRDKEPIDIINFLHKAQLSGADPRRDEIYLVGYFDKRSGKMKCSTIYSYHFMLKRAATHPDFNGVNVKSEPLDVFNPISGETVKMLVATASTVRKNVTLEFQAHWNEFFQPFNPIWKSKPRTMLEKCAVANVLRRAFPDVDINDMIIDGEQPRPDYVEIDKKQITSKISEAFSDEISE